MSAGMDAGTDGFRLSSGLLDMNAAYTFMGWFRLASDTNNYNCFFAVSYNDSQYDFIGTWSDGTTLLAEIANAGVWDDIGSADLSDFGWHHIAFVRESTTSGKLYYDGVLNATSTTSVASRAAAAYMDVGTWAINSADFLTGSAFALKAWATNLSVEDIQAEMQTIAPRRFENLWGFWPVLPGSGERVRDYSGNGRDWTESGTITDDDHPPISWGVGAWLTAVIASGTAYTQSISGTLSTAGSALKETGKLTAGALASAGALIRLAGKLTAGALSTAGSAVKRVGKVAAGTLTSAGAAAGVRTVLQSLAGALASAGALVRETGKGAAGTLSTAGELIRQAGKLTAGTLTSAGAVTGLRTILQSVSGALASAGALARQTGKITAGTLSTAGALVRQAGKTLSGALGAAGTLAGVRTILLAISGVLSMAGGLTRAIDASIAGILSVGGAVTRQTARLLAGVLSMAGAVSGSISGVASWFYAYYVKRRRR